MSASQTFTTVPARMGVVATNERITGPAAIQLIHQSDILHDNKKSNDTIVLDNATGGGVLLSELLKLTSTTPTINIQRLVAGDTNNDMLAYTRARAASEHWTDAVHEITIQNFDQQSLPFPAAAFTHVFNNFGVFFTRDDHACLQETYRVLRPGGSAHFATWKAISWWNDLVVPVLARDFPDVPPLPAPEAMFSTSGWNDAAAIPAKLEAVGFDGERVEEFAFVPDVGAEEFAEACAVLVGFVAKRTWPGEVYEVVGPKIQPALLAYLRSTYPDGKYNGTMVAIISGGWKR